METTLSSNVNCSTFLGLLGKLLAIAFNPTKSPWTCPIASESSLNGVLTRTKSNIGSMMNCLIMFCLSFRQSSISIAV